jgi:hypothetical protein
MQQPTQPQQTQPEFQPQGQREYYNPMNQGYQGGGNDGGQGPIPAPQGAPQYIQEQQPNVQIRPPEPNGTSFVPDADTRSILDSVHPELLNAAINVAIKKFSATEEFVGFYVRSEYRSNAEENREKINEIAKEKQSAAKEQSAPAKQAMDFSSW